MKVVNLETIIDMQVVVQDLATQKWIQVVSVQIKNFTSKLKEACKSSWSQIWKPKSRFALTLPVNLAKPVKISPGIIARLHHTDRKQMRLVREQYAE